MPALERPVCRVRLRPLPGAMIAYCLMAIAPASLRVAARTSRPHPHLGEPAYQASCPGAQAVEPRSRLKVPFPAIPLWTRAVSVGTRFAAARVSRSARGLEAQHHMRQ